MSGAFKIQRSGENSDLIQGYKIYHCIGAAQWPMSARTQRRLPADILGRRDKVCTNLQAGGGGCPIVEVPDDDPPSTGEGKRKKEVEATTVA